MILFVNFYLGALLLGGVLQVIVRTVAAKEDLSFGPSGIITATAGIALIMSGIFGYCYYPDTKLNDEHKSTSCHRRHKINDVEPFNGGVEGASDIYNIPPPPLASEDSSFGRATRAPLQSNTVPNNFASRFWKENVVVSKDPFTSDVPYPAD